MNAPQTPTSAWKKRVAICAFIGLLWLPTIGGVFHWDKSAGVDENRALVAFPGLPAGLSGVRSYVSQLEAWYNDHFGFRKWLIYQEQKWKRQWIGEAQSRDVLIGRNGWLYFATGEASDVLQTNALFTRGQLEAWRSLLEGRRDWLAARGIPYLVVIPPDKQSIYPEYLPEWRTRAGSVTKLDQFVDYMRAHSTVAVVDLRPALLEAKANGRVFLQKDSHWNQYGAFIACEQVIHDLARQVPGLKPLSLDDFDQKFTSVPGGNLARILAAQESMREKDYVKLVPREPLKILKCARTDVPAAAVNTEENPGQKGRALIFGDSFGEGWFPFIGYHFGKVTLVRLYDRVGDPDKSSTRFAHCWQQTYIEMEKPTVLIDEIVEDSLCHEDPAYIKKLDALK